MNEDESPIGEEVQGSKLIGPTLSEATNLNHPQSTPKRRSIIPQRLAIAIASAGTLFASIHGQAEARSTQSPKVELASTLPSPQTEIQQQAENPTLLFDRSLTESEKLFFQPYLDIKLGQTTEDQVNLLPVKEKNDLGNGYTEYVFNNPALSWYNTAVVKDGVVTFKRIVPIIGEGKAIETPAVSSYTKTYGTPAQTLQGSKTFGPQASIWVNNGFSIIGNNRTNEVYAIEYFSGADYLQEMGNDFQANPQTSPRI